MKIFNKFKKYDRTLFILGFLFFISIILFLLILLLTNKIYFLKTIGVIGASLAGGRLTAILTGIELKFNNIFIIIILSSINMCWLLLVFPFITFSYHNIVENKLFNGILKTADKKARSYKSNLSAFGALALPVFIWLPFPMTGSIVGSFIGHLMGIQKNKLLFIVILSMLLGIVTWTYGFRSFLFVTGPTGKTIAYICVFLIILYSILDKIKTGKNSGY